MTSLLKNPGARASSILKLLREKRPLIHHITNSVVMNLTANATLAAGALPVMAHAVEEAADMASTADALVLNMGTPSPAVVEAMVLAGRAANVKGIPVVFDPVGAGATEYRNEVARRLLGEIEMAVIRGNPAEIAGLAGLQAEIRGVEAGSRSANPRELAIVAARRTGRVVAITGPQDHISNGAVLATVGNGHAMMASITGSGCVATAMVAAFCAVEPDPVVAAYSALAFAGAAGQSAATASEGPGSFHAAWLDALWSMTPDRLSEMAVISCVRTDKEESRWKAQGNGSAKR